MLNLENPSVVRNRVASLYEELYTGAPSRGNPQFTERLLRSTFEISHRIELTQVMRGAVDLDQESIVRIAELVSVRVSSPQGVDILAHRKFNGLAPILAPASAVFGPRTTWDAALLPKLVVEFQCRARKIKKKTSRRKLPQGLSRTEIEAKRADFLASEVAPDLDFVSTLPRSQQNQVIDSASLVNCKLSPSTIPSESSKPVNHPCNKGSGAVSQLCSALDARFPTISERELLLRRWYEVSGSKAMCYEMGSACYLLSRAAGIDATSLNNWMQGIACLSVREDSVLHRYFISQKLSS